MMFLGIFIFPVDFLLKDLSRGLVCVYSLVRVCACLVGDFGDALVGTLEVKRGVERMVCLLSLSLLVCLRSVWAKGNRRQEGEFGLEGNVSVFGVELGGKGWRMGWIRMGSTVVRAHRLG